MWATISAGITSSAVPEFFCGDTLLLEAKEGFSNDSPHKIVGSCSSRAASATRATLVTVLDVGTTGFLDHLNKGIIREVDFDCGFFLSTGQDNAPTGWRR